MSKKGISPLIAAVLLIAFTMAVASLFAQWAPQLIKDAQGDTANRSSEIQRCSGVVLDIVSANNSKVTLLQTSGEDNAGNVTVTWFYTDASPLQTFVTIGSKRGTAQADITGNGGVGTLDEVQVTPANCEGAPVSTYSP